MLLSREEHIFFSLWALPQAGAAWQLNPQQKTRGCIFAVCIHNTEEADFCICLNGKPPYIMSAFAHLSCCLLPDSFFFFFVYRGIKLCHTEMVEIRRNQGENQHHSGLIQGNSKSTSKRPCSLFLKLFQQLVKLVWSDLRVGLCHCVGQTQRHIFFVPQLEPW